MTRPASTALKKALAVRFVTSSMTWPRDEPGAPLAVSFLDGDDAASSKPFDGALVGAGAAGEAPRTWLPAGARLGDSDRADEPIAGIKATHDEVHVRNKSVWSHAQRSARGT